MGQIVAELRQRYLGARKAIKILLPISILIIAIPAIGVAIGGITGATAIISSFNQALFGPIIIIGVYLVTENDIAGKATELLENSSKKPGAFRVWVTAGLVFIPLGCQVLIFAFPGIGLMAHASLLTLEILCLFALSSLFINAFRHPLQI